MKAWIWRTNHCFSKNIPNKLWQCRSWHPPQTLLGTISNLDATFQKPLKVPTPHSYRERSKEASICKWAAGHPLGRISLGTENVKSTHPCISREGCAALFWLEVRAGSLGVLRIQSDTGVGWKHRGFYATPPSSGQNARHRVKVQRGCSSGTWESCRWDKGTKGWETKQSAS